MDLVAPDEVPVTLASEPSPASTALGGVSRLSNLRRLLLGPLSNFHVQTKAIANPATAPIELTFCKNQTFGSEIACVGY